MRNERLIHIQFSPERSLQEQIKEHVLENIKQGVYGDKALPSCRKMASMLRVSRNTVVLVYEKLVDEGFLYSHQRSGYFANHAARSDDLLQSAKTSTLDPTNASGAQAQFWAQRLDNQLNQHRNIQKPANWNHYPYPFIYGQPDHSLFPLTQWRECGRLAQRSTVIHDWISDSIDADDPQLIKQLQANVLPKRGISAQTDEILITIGTQNSLYLLANLLVSAETTIGIEEPGYPDVRNIFAHHQARISPLPLDVQGIALSKQLAQCDYVYTTPSHQVPTNITMSLPRREALLKAAEQNDFVIIEDDYESEVNVVSLPSPSLKSLDTQGRVIYVGSLSKSLSPGLRLGYMVADKHLIAAARKLRRLMYRHPPTNNQRTSALFISLGYYDSYLRKLRASYIEKWTEMRQAIDQFMPQTVTHQTVGGSPFWLKLPNAISAQTFAEEAEKIGVLVEPGDVHFYHQSPDSQHYVRLAYSAISREKIAPGIEKLAMLLNTLSA